MNKEADEKPVRKIQDFAGIKNHIEQQAKQIVDWKLSRVGYETGAISLNNLAAENPVDTQDNIFYYFETNEQGEKGALKCYFVEKDLGKGSHGQVWLVYPIKDDGSIDDSPAQAKALKRLDLSKCGEVGVDEQPASRERLQTEVTLGRQNAFNHAVYLNPGDTCRSDAFILMDYAPGTELAQEQHLKKLTFPQRIQAIMQLCMAVNIVHHETPSTGPAVVHADIKPNNLKIDVRSKKDPKTQKDLSVIDVHLLDFGLSEDLSTDSSVPKATDEIKGTPNYIAPQFMQTKNDPHISRKVDIYALVGVIGEILGQTETEILKQKKKYNFQKDPRFYTAPFNIVLTISEKDKAYEPLKPYLDRFLDKMQAKSYAKQPDTDEVLKFFTLMNQVCLEFQAQSDQNRNQDFKVDQIADFESFKTEFELLINYTDDYSYKIKKRQNSINDQLSELPEDFPENLKQSFIKARDAVVNAVDGEDKFYLLTLLADSLGERATQKKITQETLEKIYLYSLKCKNMGNVPKLSQRLADAMRDYWLVLQKETIQKTLAQVDRLPDALKQSANTVLSNINKLEPADQVEPLRLLSESLTQYVDKKLVQDTTLQKLYAYSLQCQGSPSPKLKAVGIGMMVLGIGLAVLGSLCLVASLGLMATGVLAPLSIIGIAGSGAMIGTGFASVMGGFCLFQKNKTTATGLSKSVCEFEKAISDSTPKSV